MDRVYEANAHATTPPSAPATPSTGYPKTGDPATADPATVAGSHWFYMVTEELRYLVAQAGLTPSHTNYHQVHDAVAALIAVGSNSIPVGAGIPFFGGTVHTGFLKANGAAVSRTTYAALFAEIGTTYGAGDGTTTFNLPDSRGEFLRGWDDARGIDAGRALGSWEIDEFKAHNHNVNWGSYDTAAFGAARGSEALTSSTLTQSAGGLETRPRNLAVQFLIKY